MAPDSFWTGGRRQKYDWSSLDKTRLFSHGNET